MSLTRVPLVPMKAPPQGLSSLGSWSGLVDLGGERLADLAWAASTLRLNDPSLLDALSGALASALSCGELAPRHTAGAVFAFAKMRHPARQLMAAAAAAAEADLSAFSARDVSMLLWALATARTPAGSLFALAAESAATDLARFGAADTAMMLSAYASARQRCPALLAAVGADAPRLLQRATPRELASVVSAFATLRAPCPALLAAAERPITVAARKFHPRDLALLLRAHANLAAADQTCQPPPALLDELAAAAAASAARFGDKELAMSVWALGSLGHAHAGWMAAAATEGVARAPRLSSTALSNLAWGYAKLRAPAPELATAVARAAAVRLRRPGSVSGREMATLAWAMAEWDQVPPHSPPRWHPA